MSAKTKRSASSTRSAKEQKLLDQIQALGVDIQKGKAALSTLTQKRDDLFLRGRSQGLSFAEMGRAAGIRRETVHYAALRRSQTNGKAI